MALSPEETRVLVVEDGVLDRKLLTLHLERAGYTPQLSSDGLEAWELISKNRFDVVLLDRTIPSLDGIALLQRIKAHPRLRMLPVILQTAAVAPDDILEGIRAGAYYYLTKPWDPLMLLEIVRTAANDYAEYREVQAQLRQGLQTLRLLDEAVFTIRTIDEAKAIGAILANVCPDPYSAVIGLTELLLNAVEHGSLGITYEEKSALKDRDQWTVEVERRLALPENAGKRVRIAYEKRGEESRFTIRDEGAGFDWRRFLDVDPSRAFDTHGRGIAVARRFSFDALEYHDPGNEVVARVKPKAAS
jgi:CheY-like chemotaxis protein/anti-sigma regulatory factor (Ser/Thr protein kinase)